MVMSYRLSSNFINEPGLLMNRFILFIFILLLSGCAALPDRYTSLSRHQPVRFDDLLKTVEKQRVIFVGEIHDSASSHRVQLEIIRHLHERGKNVAVALEMFLEKSQEDLNRWTRGALKRAEFMKAYHENWNIPYRYYGRIFEYARKEKIPLIGINTERSLISYVSKNGLHEIPEDDLKRLRFSDCSEDPVYASIIEFAEGEGIHASNLPFLCEGQRLRDAVMAFHIAAILKDHEHTTVVVLLGAAHALKPAVPQMLAKHTDAGYKIVIPGEYFSLLTSKPDETMADFIWID